MASFSFRSVCYPDHLSAMEAFLSIFPYDNGSNKLFAVVPGSYSVNSSGLISYQVTSGGAASSQSYQLLPCGDLSSRATFDKLPINDILVAGIFVLLLAFGFSSGLRIRK